MDVAKPRPSARGAKNSFREFHTFLARLLDVPELEMSDEEASRFTEAYREVRRHFPVPSVDPKWVALGTFAYVAYGVYAPRVAAVAAKKRGRSMPPNGSSPNGSSLGASEPAAALDLAGSTVTAQDWFAGTA